MATITAEALAEMNAKKERMDLAFALVDPTRFGAKDWREPIDAFVTSDELSEAGVTIDEVKEAVEYMTATKAYCDGGRILGYRANGMPITNASGEPKVGYTVRAIGYRRGPAGP